MSWTVPRQLPVSASVYISWWWQVTTMYRVSTYPSELKMSNTDGLSLLCSELQRLFALF